jgi:hypothetical protein
VIYAKNIKRFYTKIVAKYLPIARFPQPQNETGTRGSNISVVHECTEEINILWKIALLV